MERTPTVGSVSMGKSEVIFYNEDAGISANAARGGGQHALKKGHNETL